MDWRVVFGGEVLRGLVYVCGVIVVSGIIGVMFFVFCLAFIIVELGLVLGKVEGDEMCVVLFVLGSFVASLGRFFYVA